MTEAVAIQAEILTDLRAATGGPVWPSDTLADLGVTRGDAPPDSTVADLIAASVRSTAIVASGV